MPTADRTAYAFCAASVDYGNRISLSVTFCGDGETRHVHVLGHRELETPGVLLSRDEARALMDALWNCNVRPTSVIYAPNKPTPEPPKLVLDVNAQAQAHLDDMRRIAMRLLDLVAPERVVVDGTGVTHSWSQSIGDYIRTPEQGRE